MISLRWVRRHWIRETSRVSKKSPNVEKVSDTIAERHHLAGTTPST